MSYTVIPGTAIDQDSPLTQDLLTAYRDNIIYTAGAGWVPYDMAEVGDGATGEFYNSSTDGSLSSIESPAFSDGNEYRVVLVGLGISSSSANILVGLYLATSASYQELAIYTNDGLTPSPFAGDFLIKYPRRSANIHFMDYSWVEGGSVGLTALTPAGQYSYHGTAQKIGKWRMRPTNGSINAGQAYLFRRNAPI